MAAADLEDSRMLGMARYMERGDGKRFELQRIVTLKVQRLKARKQRTECGHQD
jgi:hypothetical protein